MPNCEIDGFAAHYAETGTGETIVLLHAEFTSFPQTLQAVGAILDGLDARGLRAVTVSELLDDDADVAAR